MQKEDRDKLSREDKVLSKARWEFTEAAQAKAGQQLVTLSSWLPHP